MFNDLLLEGIGADPITFEARQAVITGRLSGSSSVRDTTRISARSSIPT